MRTSALPFLAALTLVAGPSALSSQTPARPDTTAQSPIVQPAVADTIAPTTLRAVRVVETRRAVYAASRTTTATKTATLLRDVPQSMSVVARDLIRDAGMQGMADVVRFVPGVTMGQGEGNRDQPTIRGNSSTADFFVDGVRDDVQYFRDLYNVEQVEALKGPNAMIFGRGGGGGVLNRVTKDAQWIPVRELLVQGGSFDNKRASLDVGGGFSRSVAARLNGMYERSGFFRDGVTLRRSGINPTVTIAPGARTRVALGYEYFTDHRTADRGIPSFGGRPIGSDVATFFGDPDASYADVRVHAAAATVAHETARGLTIRNRTRVAAYDKIYQNVFPGAVNAAGDEVSISAYNNGTQRQNLFNQTDLTSDVSTGSVRHTLLAGAEVGRQTTDNLRNTGYFNDTDASVSVPVRSPTISTPVAFRQSATDADNRVVNAVASLYAQDQLALSEHWQIIAGVRYERFDVRYHNNRTDSTLRRVDRMISPRAGLLFKPMQPLSFYASHSVSYLPSAGDQFSSLTDVTKALEPERFTNYEVGGKWDVADRVALTTAVYRLDRTNTRAPDPTDPARTLQTGSQRTNGFEIGVTGSLTPAWEIAGGYARQDAFITSTTTAAPTGARAPLVPRHTLSLWNRYQLSRRLGAGIGVIHRADMYAAIDDKVTLPSFIEVDGAVYLTLARGVRLQANVENLFNVRYYSTANGNNNISPGSPRAVRVTIGSGF
jgi:catecholate siderophore receptor